MKKYSVKCIDQKTKEVLDEFQELSNTKKYLLKKYENKCRFIYVGSKIIVERLIRKPGV